jgi:hypothetical protein
MDSDLHLECLDTDDCRRISLRWHNRAGDCFIPAGFARNVLFVSPAHISCSLDAILTMPTLTGTNKSLALLLPCVGGSRGCTVSSTIVCCVSL